ncbi:MAG: pyruvate kinase [Bacteroidota bacterium]
MPYSQETLSPLIDKLEAIWQYSQQLTVDRQDLIADMPDTHRDSAINLLHYLGLRHFDIREMQRKLGKLGISRLGKAESHVAASMLAIRDNLLLLSGQEAKYEDPPVSFSQGPELLDAHAADLLGPSPGNRRVRIMVTFPSEAARDPKLVRKMLEAGMNVARINCAHDGPEAWAAMIKHLREAETKTGLSCKVSMDLAGPKLRTGPLEEGPKVRRIKPKKDVYGNVDQPAKVWLAPASVPTTKKGAFHVPLPAEFIAGFKAKDQLYLKDTRGKKRYIQVKKEGKNGWWGTCMATTYLLQGHKIELRRKGDTVDKARIGDIPPVPQFIPISTGDSLRLHLEGKLGEAAQLDEEGRIIRPAHISCAIPELYRDIKVGDPISMDDGKIVGMVIHRDEEELLIQVTEAGPNGSKLRAEKGINLPQTQLDLPGLTKADRKALEFVVQHADVVNMSFVNRTEDVDDLLEALEELGARPDLGIILKIETRNGADTLPHLLLRAMKRYPVGVMIARGDLAIECGWRNLAEVQEEILRVCEAAHVPIVWATQVLENLAKKGLPSRAEITDAAQSQRAECVMLNKGPYIRQTIELLDEILHGMQDFQHKKAPMLPALK